MRLFIKISTHSDNLGKFNQVSYVEIKLVVSSVKEQMNEFIHTNVHLGIFFSD